jgi:phage/plasmid-like protein (TIGR03299 family)
MVVGSTPEQLKAITVGYEVDRCSVSRVVATITGETHMAHGIMELDGLMVGFVELYGNAWHNHPNCKHKDGAVTIDEARAIFGYAPELVPLIIQELLAWLESGILLPYQVSLESVGTLLNGQKAFVNIILNEHVVPGDNSKTVTRLMYSNSFGGDSLQGCAHTTRIVCNNTLRVAVAQGAANNTLRKFRHTKNASLKIEEHMVELTELVATIREHHEKIDMLATMPMSVEQVRSFIDALVPVPVEEGRGKTRRTNQQEAILKIFEEKDDLQGKIAKTRYAMLQAVTDWADHDSSVRNGDDQGGRFWDGIWGGKDEFKQEALKQILEVGM